MSGRGLILILALLLAGASAIFFGQAYLRSLNNRPPPVADAPIPPPPTMVLVAKADIPIGTFLREEMVGWQAWPAETLDPSYMVKGQPDPKTQQPFDPKTLIGPANELQRAVTAFNGRSLPTAASTCPSLSTSSGS